MAGLVPTISLREALYPPKRDHRDSALARRPGDDRWVRSTKTTVEDAILLRDRLLVRIDHVTTLVLRRIDDDIGFQIAELVEAVALDVLELGRQRALLLPLACRAEFHVADHGLERGLV